mmetsp:Transcript_19601/g.39927  ORF Transcript_19601/g.39927 Transcript_19601/m.39927 type:complete len:281 (-) Transcript_19601:118-960(-)
MVGAHADGGPAAALADFEVVSLVARMRGQQLGTDQRELAAQVLQGRTLTCRQAGAILGVVQLGIMQRMLAFEVLKGRLSDLPHGLPDLLQPLSGRILIDVGSEFGGDAFDRTLYSSRSSTASMDVTPRQAAPHKATDALSLSLNKQNDLTESVDRLRSHVCTGDVSDALYQDVKSVFDALGLGQLPPKQPTPRGAVGHAPLRPVAVPPKHLSKLPGKSSAAGGPPLPPLNSVPCGPPDAPAPVLDTAIGATRHAADPNAVLPGQVDDPGTPRSVGSEESV